MEEFLGRNVCGNLDGWRGSLSGFIYLQGILLPAESFDL